MIAAGNSAKRNSHALPSTAIGRDINAVADTPRFYNTLLHNCKNELTRRVEVISTARFPFTWKTLLPGYFDAVPYEMGLIPASGTFEETKAIYCVDNSTVDPTSESYSRDLRLIHEPAAPLESTPSGE